MKKFATLTMLAAMAFVGATPALGSGYSVSSVNDLTPSGPLASSPAKARYVSSVGTASSFEIWYEDRTASKLHHATGSYSGGVVTLAAGTEVTLTGAATWSHPEVIKTGSTYHMINWQTGAPHRNLYWTGTGTSFTYQGDLTWNPYPAANYEGWPAYGVGAFVEDSGTYMIIQDSLDGYHFEAWTTNPAGLTWNHNVPTLAARAQTIMQPGGDVRLTPSGDLIEFGGQWLYFVPDEADGGLGMVDLGTDFTQAGVNQDWAYDPDGDALGYSGPILGISSNPGLGGANTRTEFKEATLLPTGNAGEFLVLYTAEWGGNSQIGAAVIQVVPEPASAALLLLGLPLVMRRRRRR